MMQAGEKRIGHNQDRMEFLTADRRERSIDVRGGVCLKKANIAVGGVSRVLEAMTVQQAVGLSMQRPLARSSHAAVPGVV